MTEVLKCPLADGYSMMRVLHFHLHHHDLLYGTGPAAAAAGA